MPKHIKKPPTPSSSEEEVPSELESVSDDDGQLGANNVFGDEDGESELYGEEGEDDIDDDLAGSDGEGSGPEKSESSVQA